MSIYEVIDNFFQWVFPQIIYDLYYPVIETMIFVLTLVVVFGLFLVPLWRLATWFLPKGGKR